MQLSAVVRELSWSQEKKTLDENKTVRRYRADSNKQISC